MEKIIRDIVAKSGQLPVSIDDIRNDDNLFDLGLASFACVQIMIAIEDTLSIEFPDELLNRQTFQTIGAMVEQVTRLQDLAA
ncbi:acyl carrier protein [Rhizobium alvei]|uniref:Acyl carrier protein n=1 Tax=Rhizobium alvei TaxID=1132659 RepID=A0ABT8YJR2_9HYPH|nr:acyl carrier protein [Rhizobium alvei]MDO6963578.1 acyl carrier protein [Rhizobium alvei]